MSESGDEANTRCLIVIHACVVKVNVPIILNNIILCSYLEKVLDYLSDYLDRVYPLLDQNSLYEEIEEEFEIKWLQGNLPGWRVSSIFAITSYCSVRKLNYLHMHRWCMQVLHISHASDIIMY